MLSNDFSNYLLSDFSLIGIGYISKWWVLVLYEKGSFWRSWGNLRPGSLPIITYCTITKP